MASISRLELLPLSLLSPTFSAPLQHQIPYRYLCRPGPKNYILSAILYASTHISGPTRPVFNVTAASTTFTLTTNSVPPRNGVYIVGDFMTRKEDLHVVKSTTTVEDALEMLVENRITGFPVIDENWKLVGLVSDYDLLALDSISGTERTDTAMFPEVDNTWKTFNEVQKLLCKTNGQVVGDLMTPAPIVVRESTNLENAARLLLETKYRRLPVVDDDGKLVGLVSDYDLLALDSISGTERTDTAMFPEVDSAWKTFNEVQKLLCKTNGQVVGDLMTPAPIVVRESTNLEDAARLLLETKYRRLPVVDDNGMLVGIITRGNVVRAALQIKRAIEMSCPNTMT